MNRKDVLKLLAILAVLVLAVLLVNRIDTRQTKAETDIVRDAVKSAALTCYAVEGAYPVSGKNQYDEDSPFWLYAYLESIFRMENEDPAIRYLRENYHLAYDRSRYLITYDAFASNLLPDIYVTERGH